MKYSILFAIVLALAAVFVAPAHGSTIDTPAIVAGGCVSVESDVFAQIADCNQVMKHPYCCA